MVYMAVKAQPKEEEVDDDDSDDDDDDDTGVFFQKAIFCTSGEEYLFNAEWKRVVFHSFKLSIYAWACDLSFFFSIIVTCLFDAQWKTEMKRRVT